MDSNKKNYCKATLISRASHCCKIGPRYHKIHEYIGAGYMAETGPLIVERSNFHSFACILYITIKTARKQYLL